MANEKIHEYLDECSSSDLRNSRVVFDVEVLTPNGYVSMQCTQSSIINTILGFDTEQGVELLKLTTAEILALPNPVEGALLYNTTIDTIVFWNGTHWHKVNSSQM